MTNPLNFQHYHLIGIKGVAMTALALILQDLGKTVSGSDTAETFQTETWLKKRNITVYSGFDSDQVKKAEVIIYGASHSSSQNIEVLTASKQQKQVYCLPEFIGYLGTLKKMVAVSGCHGKTTTSALLGYVLQKMNLQPSYFVGSADFMNFPSGKWDHGSFFVAEADEYLADPLIKRRSKFLFYKPESIIVTNLDYDHPDFFLNFEAVKKTFWQFFKRLNPSGKLIINGDDLELVKLARKSQKKYLTYGFSNTNDYQISILNNGFEIFYQKKSIISLTPKLIGHHNFANITATVVFLHTNGFNLEQARKFLSDFQGAKRRLELIEVINNNFLIDDYAHHPTEIEASLRALRNQYPNHRLALFFQLHTYSRTKKFLDQFAKTLAKVDYLGLLPIFHSAREAIDPNFNLSNLNQKLPPELPLMILEKSSDWRRFIKVTQAQSDSWVYVTMGAGDVYRFGLLISQFLHESS